LFGWHDEEEEEEPVEVSATHLPGVVNRVVCVWKHQEKGGVLIVLFQAGERDQLLKNTATLKRASDSLYRAQQVSAQTGENQYDPMFPS